MVSKVSKVVTLSTAGIKSLPISVVSNFEQPQLMIINEKSIQTGDKILLAQQYNFYKWVVFS
jgi:hypothetical protein